MPPLATELLDYGVASRPRAPSAVPSDIYAVLRTGRGLLVAVIDGLGHGPDAARAARLALSAVDEAPDRPLPWLLEDCHQALRATHGAAMVLAALDSDEREMSWCSVGNTEGIVLRPRDNGTVDKEMIVMRGGIVGQRLPPPRVTTVPVDPGDLLILATDGIRAGFETEVELNLPVQHIADTILARHAKTTDDALVLVGRFGAGAARRSTRGGRLVARW
jgi:negative regulator of sigma-B (phosphoserine phosphatase)